MWCSWLENSLLLKKRNLEVFFLRPQELFQLVNNRFGSSTIAPGTLEKRLGDEQLLRIKEIKLKRTPHRFFHDEPF